MSHAPQGNKPNNHIRGHNAPKGKSSVSGRLAGISLALLAVFAGSSLLKGDGRDHEDNPGEDLTGEFAQPGYSPGDSKNETDGTSLNSPEYVKDCAEYLEKLFIYCRDNKRHLVEPALGEAQKLYDIVSKHGGKIRFQGDNGEIIDGSEIVRKWLWPTPEGVIISPGDTLSEIALRYRVNLDTILSLNPDITDANVVPKGKYIRLK